MGAYQLWNAYMIHYDFLMRVDGYRIALMDIIRRLPNPSGLRILDAGSGTGNLSIALREQGADVTSCDLSYTAQAIHLQKDPHAKLITTSLEDRLPLKSDDFDAVCCASVLFALSEEGCRLALSEFYRILAPQGRLVLTVPSTQQRTCQLIGIHGRALIQKKGLLRGMGRGLLDLPAMLKVLYYAWRLQRLQDWQGWHRFTKDELERLLQSAGFESVVVERTYGDRFLMATCQKKEGQSRSSRLHER